MENIFNPRDRQAVLIRLKSIEATTPAIWGKMNANQMICHLRDQLLVATGDRSAKPVNTAFTRTWAGKRLALGKIPWPKGKVKTPYEMDQNRGGTHPTQFAKDRELLMSTLEKVITIENDELQPHPTFGKLGKQDWGRLIWKHFDHHLKQFGA